MKPPRGLSDAEAEAWARLAASVTPLHPGKQPSTKTPGEKTPADPVPRSTVRKPAPVMPAVPEVPFSIGSGRRENTACAGTSQRAESRPAITATREGNLDSHWERRLTRAARSPAFTLDLHGHTLDQAHARLDHGIGQAKAMGARLVLVVTGKPRPVDAADRGSKRGAIRAKILDWLAAGPHASSIAAIRKAHRRHGGEGALYIILKRGR